jgi:AmmeMemoRadiSam system protein A
VTEPLTPEERRDLLARARRAAALAVAGAPPGPEPGQPKGRLAEPGCAFVTWRREGRLRGCIGSVQPTRTLAEDVVSNAVSALVRDPRFAPATARDLPGLTLEISVLSPFETIAGADGIEIGVHGLYVQKGRRGGLLLPQVPVEWSWSVPEFLEQLCFKAGLPPDGWRPESGAILQRFTAEVFGESA